MGAQLQTVIPILLLQWVCDIVEVCAIHVFYPYAGNLFDVCQLNAFKLKKNYIQGVQNY